MKHWNSIQVKDQYSSVAQLRILKQLLSDKYGIADDDIHIPGNCEVENPLGNYVFIRHDDFPLLWMRLSTEKMVDNLLGHLEIPDDEMQGVLNESLHSESESGPLCLYDIVKVTCGTYANLYGVVIDAVDDKYLVGFKFFSGTRTCEFDRGKLQKTGGLFEIWKFPARQ